MFTLAIYTPRDRKKVFYSYIPLLESIPTSANVNLCLNLDPDVKDLLKKLYISDPTLDRRKISLANPRVKGTCEWLLESKEYKDWLSTDCPQLLWLLGPPGIGKTSISCFLVEKLQKSSAFIVCYFCDDKIKGRRTATDVLRGILWQLFKRREDLFELIKDDYRVKKESLTENLDDMWDMLLTILPSICDPVYLILDALDECDVLSRKELLMRIEHLDLPKDFRILITGRPEADIDDTARVIGVSLTMNGSNIKNDLEAFITTKVNRLRMVKREFTPELLTDIERSLRINASGTFLWVSLIIGDIGDARTTIQGRKKLESLPTGLPETYDRLMANIQKEELEVALLILQWLVVSARPMEVIEMATALTLDASPRWAVDRAPTAKVVEDRKDAFRSCGMLVNYNEIDDTVTLFHQSVKEYLLAGRISRKTGYLQNTETCWRYLSFRDFRQGTALIHRPNQNTLHLPSALPVDLVAKHGLVKYAMEALCFHITADRLQSIVDFIKNSDDLGALTVLRDYWFRTFAEYGNIQAIEAVLDKGADINVQMKDYYTGKYNTALHVATHHQNKKVIALLVERGVDTDVKNEDNRTALHIATQLHNTTITSLLLKGGASASIEDPSGRIPLFMALEKQCEDVAYSLLETPFDLKLGGPSVRFDLSGHQSRWHISIETKLDTKRETVLFPAVRNGAHQIAQKLVDKGVDVNAQNKFGLSAVTFSVVMGDLEMVRLLLDSGADVEHTGTDSGSSLIHLALGTRVNRNPVAKMVKLLVERDAKLDTLSECHMWNASKWRCPPIHAAIQLNNREAVDVLLAAKADASMRDGWGLSALHHAAYCGFDDLIVLLLDTGSDLEERDTVGWTPLHFAVDGLKPSTVILLTSRGADINAVTKDGDTVIHLAAGASKRPLPQDPNGTRPIQHLAEMIQILTEKGVNINTKGPGGMTALHTATRALQVEVVKILVDSGAAGNIPDAEGQTTLHTFARRSHKMGGRDNQYILDTQFLVRSLLQSGANIEARDHSGRTPLFYAINSGGDNAIYLFLRLRANLWTMCSDGEPATGFWVESVRRNLEKLLPKCPSESLLLNPIPEPLLSLSQQVFLLEKARLEPSDKVLIQATERGFYNLVSILLGAHDTGNTFTYTFTTEAKASALCIAIREGHEKVVRVLLENGVDAHKGDRDLSPLSEAIQANCQGIIELLLTWGANDHVGLVAAADQGDADMVRLLLARGFDIEATNDVNQTALHVAILQGHWETVGCLVEGGANLNKVMNEGRTALHCALLYIGVLVSTMASFREDEERVAELGVALSLSLTAFLELMNRGANVNVADNEGKTPLHFAIGLGNAFSECVSQLDNDAAIGLVIGFSEVLGLGPNDNVTALGLAIGVNDMFVGELIRHGADINVKDQSGSTPLSIALEIGNKGIVDCLQKR